MVLKRIFYAFLVAIALAIGWRSFKTPLLQAWLQPRSSTPVSPIEFDNGSVRQARAASAAAPVAAAPPRVLGTLRKCKRGETVVYTDAACPTGTKEQVLSGGTVTVLDSPKPAAAGQAVPHGDVRDLLGPRGQPTLAEQHMERVLAR